MRLPMRKLVVVVWVLGFASACSGSDDGGAGTGAGTSAGVAGAEGGGRSGAGGDGDSGSGGTIIAGGSGGAGAEGGSSGAASSGSTGGGVGVSGEPCAGPGFTPDYVMDPEFEDGAGNFYGTVELPEALDAGDTVTFLLSSLPNPTVGLASVIDIHRLVERKRRITYGVEGLEPDVFHIAVWVVRRSGVPLGGSVDEGDWYGFFGGTVESPAQYQGAAAIDIDENTLCKNDFGIGPIQCLAAYGENCEKDDDCRGTVCGTQGGGSVILHEGACEKGQCVELPCGDVPMREGSCIGWD